MPRARFLEGDFHELTGEQWEWSARPKPDIESYLKKLSGVFWNDSVWFICGKPSAGIVANLIPRKEQPLLTVRPPKLVFNQPHISSLIYTQEDETSIYAIGDSILGSTISNFQPNLDRDNEYIQQPLAAFPSNDELIPNKESVFANLSASCAPSLSIINESSINRSNISNPRESSQILTYGSDRLAGIEPNLLADVFHSSSQMIPQESMTDTLLAGEERLPPLQQAIGTKPTPAPVISTTFITEARPSPPKETACWFKDNYLYREKR